MLTHWTKVVNRADMRDRVADIFNVFRVCVVLVGLNSPVCRVINQCCSQDWRHNINSLHYICSLQLQCKNQMSASVMSSQSWCDWSVWSVLILVVGQTWWRCTLFSLFSGSKVHSRRMRWTCLSPWRQPDNLFVCDGRRSFASLMWFGRRFDLQIAEMFLTLWNRSQRDTLRRESVRDQNDKPSVRGTRRDAHQVSHHI